MVDLWFMFVVCFLNFNFTYTVNVEYAHKAAIRKHALWLSIIVDLLMGFVLGAAFLLNTETICIWTIVSSTT
jgi:phosphatidylinositol N-acetylglucosaminyltransferase subunit Q